MLFFIISRAANARGDYRSIEVPLHVQDAPWDHAKCELIAWNEVPAFSTPEKFLAALVDAASQDPVCVQMMGACRADFGLNFLAPDDHDAQQILYSTFYYWVHPLIGNLGNSPKMRSPDEKTQISHWSTFVSAGARAAMERLLSEFAKQGLPKLVLRAARDQTKLHHNIVEAARAFIGEITCAPAKRLEKLLALRLCRSPKLLRAQIELIQMYWGKRRRELETAVKSSFGKMEYCRYYFEACPKVSDAAAVNLLHALVASATGLEADYKPDKVVTEYFAVWNKLPRTMRCAVLLNDFRKLDATLHAPLAKQTAMCFVVDFLGAPPERRLFRDTIPHRSVLEQRIKGHVPLEMGDALRFAFNSNRDEYAPTVITYRLNLCPLWGGPSNHTVGGICHWLQVLGHEAPSHSAMTIAASLGTLWRLYFDKRISPDHTMTEAFEATFNSTVTGGRSALLPCRPIPMKKPVADAFDFLDHCGVRFGRLQAVDPICVFRLLPSWTSKNYKALKTLINEERRLLTTEGCWVPQWSHESSVKIDSKLSDKRALPAPRTGVHVAGFSSPLALISEYLGSPEEPDLLLHFQFEALKAGALGLMREHLGPKDSKEPK